MGSFQSEPLPPNPALNLAPFGRWTLREKAAQRAEHWRWGAHDTANMALDHYSWLKNEPLVAPAVAQYLERQK